MRTESAYWATIYIGRLDFISEKECLLKSLAAVCRYFCDKTGICVSFTETTYVYWGGKESGIIVGLINYPRFPNPPEILKNQALELAKRLKVVAKQEWITVVFPNEIISLNDEDDKETFFNIPGETDNDRESS